MPCRADARLLAEIIGLIPESKSFVLMGDGEDQDTARILVKMTLEASRLGKEWEGITAAVGVQRCFRHIVGLSVEDFETAQHIARSIRASCVQAGVNSDRAATVLPYEGAIRTAQAGDAFVIFATDLVRLERLRAPPKGHY